MENVPATAGNQPDMILPAVNTPLAVMQGNISRQPIMKQIGFLLAIAASIALGGYVLMWSQTPNYQVLFNNMAPKDSSRVIDVLQQMNIDYKLDPATGALMVPTSEIQNLRIKLAAEGLPHGVSSGMEMLNEDQGFGTSQFIERARYQRAMEEELSRSIAELHNVRSARVHLAIPKQSVFIRNRKEPTASVVLNMYAGRVLESRQVMAITHMVASSVPNMTSANVTVVDQRGNLLSRPEREQGVAMSDSQLDYTRKLEQVYIDRIEDILAPIVGLGGVRAQVVAEVDFTLIEQTHESYNPDIAALRSEQIREDERTGNQIAMGVPGALTNIPPGGGVAPEKALNQGQRGDGNARQEGETYRNPQSSSKRATRNFELDRTISHTRAAPGSLKRLSVAVLINERRSIDDAGEVVSTPMTESEMKRINALVMDAIGFNKARGDSLNIVNAPFVAPEAVEPLPEISLLEQPWVWNLAKQILGGLVVLFLIFGVIRPAFKDLNKVPEGGRMVERMQAEKGGVGGDDMAKLSMGSEQIDEQLTNVKSLVQQDPALVAQVVKNWTMSDG